jgi:phage terminase large subunit GpA-like protein
MGPTQLLKTELINNICGYFVHQDPSPMIVMQPTVSLAQTFSKDRLDKMIRDTPVLRELFTEKKSRDSANTIHHKQFVGGHVTIIGANSPSELASRPVRITLRDEIDKYTESAGDEGDPSSLIRERTATFWNSLDVGVCSPTVKGRSAVEQEYLKSDQRKFHVDCLHCGHNHFMKWENVRWEDKDASTGRYVCPQCETPWSEKDRIEAIKGGRYVAYAPFNGHAGFHVNKLASPWESIPTIVQKYLDAEGDAEKMKTFINTQLAETYEERGEAPEHMRLYERREAYAPNSIPNGVSFLTAGVDVQGNRLELEIVGWGKGKISHSIDYRVIMGDTATEAPWLELTKVFNETWLREDGTTITIAKMAVDSGYNTLYVYDWVRKYKATGRVLAVKGQDALNTALGRPREVDRRPDGSPLKYPVVVFPVGVSTLKAELYGWLNLDGAKDDGVYPQGFCHFPMYDENYFQMLTAEEMVTTLKDGKPVYRWVKTYPRNEALDCRVYARAAASNFGMDRFKDGDWEALAGIEAPKAPKPANVQESTQARPVDKPTQPTSSGFWKGSGTNLWRR